MSIFGPGAGLPVGTTPEETLEGFAKLQLGKNLPLNIGTIIIGLVFDLMFFGVTCHQMIVFLRSPGKDRRFIKALVWWTFGMGTLTTGYGMFYVYYLFVTNFGHFLNFLYMDKIAFYSVMGVAIIVPVQIFYLERAYRLLHQRKWIPIAIVPMMVGSVIGAVGLTVVMRRFKSTADLPTLKVWFYLWDVATVATDIALTVLMLIGLRKTKTGWSSTDALVSRLIRTSAEAQLFPTIVAIGFLVTYASPDTSFASYFWCMMLGKSYVVSLLAVLNFRVSASAVSTGASGGSDPQEDKIISGLSDDTRIDEVIPMHNRQIPDPKAAVNPTPGELVSTFTYGPGEERELDHFHRPNFTPRRA